MGKPKTLSKKAKKLAKKKGIETHGAGDEIGIDVGKYSIEDILDKADGFIEEYNYDMAQKFLQRALEINNDHPRALETIASLLLEVIFKVHKLNFEDLKGIFFRPAKWNKPNNALEEPLQCYPIKDIPSTFHLLNSSLVRNPWIFTSKES